MANHGTVYLRKSTIDFCDNLVFSRQNIFKNKALTLKQNYEKNFEIYAKKKGIVVPVKRKPAAPRPKKVVKEEVIVEELDDDVEI